MGRSTLEDVSERAGVSRSTASLVVRGSSKISPATRDRVLRAMEELGYVYNRYAAMMRQSKSFTIGLVVTEIHNPYFAEVTMVIEEAMHDASYQVFVGYSRDSAQRQGELIQAMLQRQVDGIILLPAIGSEESGIEDVLTRDGVPTVQIARRFTSALDYVGPDNVAAGRDLARHIESLGVSTAVLVGGPSASSARRDRLQGLVEGFARGRTAFDPSQSVQANNTPDDGARGMAAVLDRGELPGAVIAYSDATAIGIYSELRQRGLKPGRVVAVASFDDIPLAAMQVPPLTSVATHPQLVAERASSLLLERIDHRDSAPSAILIDPTLKVRASTTKWRRRA
ncbi:LacI family DNA-binding transcriptional regulator [Cellulomonas sp.]|uniref:LacI family DNA-binding transcriptional regulator n=1 Tax=Cellulomonas sp. TaxID=40001 RepID=UPI003BA9B909